jgi:hypothetical protein
MFRVVLPPSSGAHTAVSTAPGICHTVTAICRYRGRVGTGSSVLWVAYATHSTLELKCTAFFNWVLALHCWPIATTLIEFVAHEWRIRSMEFKESPYNGSRDAADEVGCRPHILLITLHRRIILVDGPDVLTRNVGNELPISPAKHPRTARISHRGRSLISRNPTSITVILTLRWDIPVVLS